MGPTGGSRSPADRSRRERALVSPLRTLVALLVMAALVLGAVAIAPTVLDELGEGPTPIASESPPPAGEREPAEPHPGDPGNSSYDGPPTVDAADVEAFIHHEVNDRRADRNLTTIEWDATVASVSRAHSADMHERDYFDHDNPDGQSPYDRFQEVAGYCRTYGENLAMTWIDRDIAGEDGDRHRTAEDVAVGVVEQWMDSPPHREAMFEENWDRGGVGVYLGDDGKVLATHNFCTEW